jgi:uncharacterized SAM-binding protein YcdF (DUF218 family)
MAKKIALILVAFIISNIFFYKEILTGYAEFFHIDNATKGADAIVVLSGDMTKRIDKAIELQKNGYANKILMTQQTFKEHKYDFVLSPAEIKKRILQYHHITNYETVNNSKANVTSTFDEAYDIARYAKEHNLKHIIIVTNDFHTRRALYAFDKIFAKFNLKDKVLLEVSSVKNGNYKDNNWWKHEAGLKAYPLEGIKYLMYLLNDTNLNSVTEE